MGGCLEYYAERMESNRPNSRGQYTRVETPRTCAYPIILSYCCCRILLETWQSTCPLLRVIASASAISPCMVLGIDGFLFAGPTHTSVDPLCSNSLAPNCVISAPETSDKTTLLGNLDSSCASTPRVCVVLTRIHVCWGVTTDSMTAARS